MRESNQKHRQYVRQLSTGTVAMQNQHGKFCGHSLTVDDAVSGLAVATRTARLLVVSGDRLRKGVVDDVANIGLVDTHSERDRRTDHLDLDRVCAMPYPQVLVLVWLSCDHGCGF